MEFKVNGDGIYLIEINPRVPGDRISDLVLMAAGVDLWDRWIDILTDRPSPRPGAAAVRRRSRESLT